jgi:Zn-dependent peptidase ImmA (M78 family)
MIDIKRTVAELTHKYQTNNPFQIAKEKNIILRFDNLVNTYGYYLFSNRIQIIHINNTLDETLQRFVCAHELGHAVLHPKANTPFLKRSTFFSIDKIEVEANTFAVELLMLDEIIYEYENTNLSIYEIGEMYGVPRELCHLKNF